MRTIDRKLLQEITELSKKSPRRRANVIFHKFEEKVQRMVQVLQPDTYAQPHIHKDPDKTENFCILTGKMAVLTFDSKGHIEEKAILNPESGVYAVDIPARTWHTIVCLEPNTAVFEVIEGPYEEMSHKKFAQWAPKEGTLEANIYLKGLKKQLTS